MKAYNQPTDELHIESNDGQTLVSITKEKSVINNIESNTLPSFPTFDSTNAGQTFIVSDSGELEMGSAGSEKYIHRIAIYSMSNPILKYYLRDIIDDSSTQFTKETLRLYVKNNGEIPIVNPATVLDTMLGAFYTVGTLRYYAVDTTIKIARKKLSFTVSDNAVAISATDDNVSLGDNVMAIFDTVIEI